MAAEGGRVKTVGERSVLESLVQRLSRVSPDDQRRWGTMTAHEMLCHLGDSSELIVRKRPRASPAVRRGHAILKALGLWTPFRWPHGWRTNPKLDPRAQGTRPSVFDGDRNRAIHGLTLMAGLTPETAEPVHGIFGPMSVRDWQRFVYKHTDHHLRQFGR